MLAYLRNRFLHSWLMRKYAPAIEVQRFTDLIRLGSDYGGWTFRGSAELQNSTIASCGLGEDASFDIEFASRFHARVIILDPTPRAIRHFEEIQRCLGQPARQSYVAGGKQPVDSYDLRNIAEESLILEPSALWVENTSVKFFAPANPDHVSHSIVNYQNNYTQDSSHIEVAAITPEALLAKYQLKSVPLMKLDIEGAEIEVIRHMMERSIRPRQLLVEFDEMSFPSARSKRNAEETDKLLKQAGYICGYFDGRANFLYALL